MKPLTYEEIELALRNPRPAFVRMTEREWPYQRKPHGCDCGRCEVGPNMLVIRCAGTAARQTEDVAG